jgi:hypothetical protein
MDPDADPGGPKTFGSYGSGLDPKKLADYWVATVLYLAAEEGWVEDPGQQVRLRVNHHPQHCLQCGMPGLRDTHQFLPSYPSLFTLPKLQATIKVSYGKMNADPHIFFRIPLRPVKDPVSNPSVWSNLPNFYPHSFNHLRISVYNTTFMTTFKQILTMC